jgi:Lipopolysaccharide-assembly
VNRTETAPLMRLLSLILCGFAAVSCAGYRLGGTKPASLKQVKSIAVPMFRNATQHPRAEALATSAAINAIVQDGTYRIATADKADAILEGELISIRYGAISNGRFDTLLPEELSNQVVLNWKLRDARNPLKTLTTGAASGTSQLFTGGNLQTAKNNALPEALEIAGESIASQLSNGF